jgi:catechol 2,3-dioxygenase-like lactoylglutathione lyase family enzyme
MTASVRVDRLVQGKLVQGRRERYMSIQIKRIGHVGLLVSDMERSLRFYTEVLECKITNRHKRPDGSETIFLRFDDWHHDLVLSAAPPGVDVTAAGPRERLIQQIAFEVEDRDAFLKALAHLHANGVKLINGPLIHGIEGGGNLGGSGSRSFYFHDPDGNRLEIFADMMRVPNGEEFPRKEYAEAMQAYVNGER